MVLEVRFSNKVFEVRFSNKKSPTLYAKSFNPVSSQSNKVSEKSVELAGAVALNLLS